VLDFLMIGEQYGDMLNASGPEEPGMQVQRNKGGIKAVGMSLSSFVPWEVVCCCS